MRRVASRVMSTLTVAGYLAVIGASSGCGDDKTGNAPMDAETKKVDQGVQDNMKSFMQSKSQPPGKTAK
jgi:hypothetical protein